MANFNFDASSLGKGLTMGNEENHLSQQPSDETKALFHNP
jgi:hypothetical protein